LPLAPIPLELQRRVIDDAIAQGDVGLLVQLAVMYLAVLGIYTALKFVMQFQRELISARITRTLRHSVYYRIYTVMPPERLKHFEAGDDLVDEGAVVSILSNEVEKLGGFGGAAISGPLLQIGTLISVLGYMFWVAPDVALIAVAVYLPQMIFVPLLQAYMNRLAAQKALKTRELGHFIVNNAEAELLNHPPPPLFTELADRILSLRTRFLLAKNTMKTLNNVLMALGPFGVICYGGYLVIQGQTEIGVVVAFVSGMERLSGPVRDLISIYRSVTDARMRYRILLESFPENVPEEWRVPLTRAKH
jgi:ABC-type bacteriocin/lantibiotic exporter with double-glycine peptidase domain